MSILKPDEFAPSAYEVEYDRLYRRGIRLLVFDIDNTLELYTAADPGEKLRGLVKRLKETGFRIALLSNGKEPRVARFGAALAVSYRFKAGKPMPKGLRMTMEEAGVTPKETAVIGDQLFTDCMAGNLAGAYTIYTEPLSREVDEAITRPKRPLEMLFLKRWRKENTHEDR